MKKVSKNEKKNISLPTNELAQEMRVGFLKTEKSFAGVSKKFDSVNARFDSVHTKMDAGFKEVHGAIVKTNKSIENLAIATKKEFDSVHTKMDSGFKEVGERLDKIENLIIRDHSNRLDKLEDSILIIRTALEKKGILSGSVK